MTDEQSGASGGINLGGFDLVTVGALIVLASWVIFDVITDDYGVGLTAAALSLAIVLIPRIDMTAVTGIAPLSAVLKLAGYLLAAVGVIEFLTDLDNNLFDAGGATIFGALIAYAGYIAAFVGARQS